MQGAGAKLYANTASEAQRSRQRASDCAGGGCEGRGRGWGEPGLERRMKKNIYHGQDPRLIIPGVTRKEEATSTEHWMLDRVQHDGEERAGVKVKAI